MALFSVAIRSEERRDSALAFATLFGVMAGHAVLETARDALFLATLPSKRLPIVYMAVALLALLASWLGRRLPRKPTAQESLIGGLLAAAAVSAAFWVGFAHPSELLCYLLYIASAMLITLVVVQFWSLLEDSFTITQAKRVFAVVGTGGLLGAIAGAGLSRALTAVAPARHLLLVACALFAASAALPALLDTAFAREEGTRAARPSRETGERPQRTWEIVWTQPFVRRLALLVLLSTLTLTLVDFLWKSTIASAVRPDRLGFTFATTYLVLNVLALVVQLFLVTRLTRSLGLIYVLAVLPSLLVVTSLGFLFGGAVALAFVIKGTDGALRHSLHRTSMELLYVPLPGDLRTRVKAFIEVLGQRGGQALASVVILALLALHGNGLVIAGAVVCLSVVWMGTVIWLRPFYLDLFRRSLRSGIGVGRTAFPSLDLASLETLIAALSSANDEEVIAALDLLYEKEKIHLVQSYILYHPSPAVVERAMSLFSRAGRKDFLPIADRFVGHLNPRVRASVLRVKIANEIAPSELMEFLADPAPLVRGTALAGLLSADAVGDARIQESLSELLEAEPVEGKIALAEAVAERPDPAMSEILRLLADNPHPAVRRAAARAMQRSAVPDFLPSLVPMLVSRELRADARDTILTIGESVVPELAKMLEDTTLPPALRLHLPRTIALFETQEAADVLLRRLVREGDGAVRFKILRVLGFLRSYQPGIYFDPMTVGDAVSATIEASFRLLHWRLELVRAASRRPALATVGNEMLVTLLAHKERHALDRLFRLLELGEHREDVRRIARGLSGPTRKIRAGSRELLENLLQPPLRGAIVGLTADSDDAERLAASGAYYRSQPLSYLAVLGLLREREGTILRDLVVYHLEELSGAGITLDEEERADVAAAQAAVARRPVFFGRRKPGTATA